MALLVCICSEYVHSYCLFGAVCTYIHAAILFVWYIVYVHSYCLFGALYMYISTACLEHCACTFILLVWSGEYGCDRLERTTVDGLW